MCGGWKTAWRHWLAACCALACACPLLADELVSRPRLEGYASYSEFLQAMRLWRLQSQATQHTEITVTIPGKGLTSLQELPEDSPEMNALLLDEASPPPLVVQGPEDLDDAVEKASHFIHPAYAKPRRYQRTTFQSFPLHQAETAQLEAEVVAADEAAEGKEQLADSLAAAVVGAGGPEQDEDPAVAHAAAGVLLHAPMVPDFATGGPQVMLDVQHR